MKKLILLKTIKIFITILLVGNNAFSQSIPTNELYTLSTSQGCLSPFAFGESFHLNKTYPVVSEKCGLLSYDQKWQFIKANGTNVYYIAGLSNTDMCLAAAGTKVVFAKRTTSNAYQQWIAQISTSSSGGRIYFKNKKTGKYLSIANNKAVLTKNNINWRLKKVGPANSIVSGDPLPAPLPAPKASEYKAKATTNLNVRSGPSTEDEIVGNILKNDVVNVISSNRGWSKISWSNGEIAYVSSNHLARITNDANNSRFTKTDVSNFAPRLILHPKEKYYPMLPSTFIKQSRFLHHIGGVRNAEDEVYNKKTKKFEKVNRKLSYEKDKDTYYENSISFISSFGLYNGKDRVPHMGDRRRIQNDNPSENNKYDDWNVFLQPDGQPRGEHDPNNNKIPVYYEITNLGSDWMVSYWYFFGYNDGPIIQNHQGDWEHITLIFNHNKELIGGYLWAHGKPDFINEDKFKYVENTTHLLFYIASGSHATYNTTGSFPTNLKGFNDKTEGGSESYKWNTWNSLVKLEKMPWRTYAGGWGEVGAGSLPNTPIKNIGGAHTTGPLGPWHKRDKFSDKIKTKHWR